MSQQVTVSDETYQALAALAAERNQTPEELIDAWVVAQERDPHTEPFHQSFDEFFQELGMSPADVQQAKDDANV